MRPDRRLLPAVIAAALLAAALLPRAAAAQDAAAAEALFDEGKRLAAESRWAEACPKFEASHAADPAVGTLLNWADCLEKEGRLGAALVRFQEAESQLRAAQDPRATLAAERAAALAERAPRLLVRSSTPPPAGLEVLLDAAALPLASLGGGGIEGPVDPGTRVVEVRRGERVVERREVVMSEGGRGEVVLDLAAIDRASAAAAPAPVAPPASPPREAPGRAPLVAGWILAGTGGVALLTAGTLGVLALGEQGDSEEAGGCREGVCSPSGFEAAESAGDLAEAAQWVGIAGVGLLAVGVTLVVTAPSGDARQAGAVRVVAGPGRLALDGRF
jgi:hypothetical protein